MTPDDPKRENPAELSLDGVSEGIGALPKRIDRYGKAKNGALDVVDYMETLPQHQATAKRVKSCGDYLAFRHYYTVDRVRLHGASLCMKHLLCPLCAIRRGAKYLKAYLVKFEALQQQNPNLKAYLVTLTVKDGPDLAERFKHLYKSQRELWMRKNRGRGSVLDGVAGAVWSYEVKRGKGSGVWHPHLHMIALAEHMDLEDYASGTLGRLSAEWQNITGDSFMVNVTPISQEDPASGFVEVFKYAVKFSEQEPADTVHAWVTLASKRLIGSAGLFRGVEVPESLLDDLEGLENLPYISYFYRYLRGSGYSIASTFSGVAVSEKLTKPRRSQADKTDLISSVVKAGRALHDVPGKDTGLSTKSIQINRINSLSSSKQVNDINGLPSSKLVNDINSFGICKPIEKLTKRQINNINRLFEERNENPKP